METSLWFYVIPFGLALVVSLVTTPFAVEIAWRLGAVDYPSRRRVNMKPIPRMGGIAVALALVVAIAGTAAVCGFADLDIFASVSSDEGLRYLGVGIAVLMIFLVGAVDDVKNIMATTKLMWQLAAAMVAVAFGAIMGDVVSPVDDSTLCFGWLAYPITVVYLVSFANIINLIDGIDGLASGVTSIAGSALFVVSVMSGHFVVAAFAAALVGSTLGFLRWNFNPAKIFLGDSGSMLLGFSLGAISLLGETDFTGMTMFLVPILMVGMPILDTFAAIVRRTRVGVSIGTPDKGHIHHRLLSRGFGQRAAVAIMYGWTALLCLCALTVTQVDVFFRAIIFIVAVVSSLLYGMSLQIFVPVMRKRFDPETGENEIVPIDEVDEADDYTQEEIEESLLGGVGQKDQTEDVIGVTEKPLRILAVSQHYWPEPFAIHDVCEGLVARGHSVTMLTGTPNYPDGYIYQGYEKGAQAKQEHNGVQVLRVPLIPRGREVWQRILNYYSFSISAELEARRLDSDYDVVLSFQTSPVMMARPALAYGKKNGVPVLLWCQDLWPESLTVGNIKRKSAVYRMYARVSREIYSSADTLAISSKSFGEYFKSALGMKDIDPVYLPQYAEDIFDGEAPARQEFDYEKINLTFAGNVGIAQAVNTFVEAGHYLEGDNRFALHVVGSGSELETLKKYKDEIGASSVEFHGRFPLAEMPSFYQSSDAMVATFQDNPILAYTLPRKIVSYMAAGRPILGTVSGEARRVIEEAGCGLCCSAEYPEGLAKICRQFAEMSPEEREAMGKNGRRYYEQHFAKKQFYSTLESELQKLKEGKGGE